MSFWTSDEWRTRVAAHDRLFPPLATYEVTFTVGADETATVGTTTDLLELSEALVAIVENCGSLRTLRVTRSEGRTSHTFPAEFFEPFERKTPRRASLCSVAALRAGDVEPIVWGTDDRDELAKAVLDVVTGAKALRDLTVLVRRKAS